MVLLLLGKTYGRRSSAVNLDDDCGSTKYETGGDRKAEPGAKRSGATGSTLYNTQLPSTLLLLVRGVQCDPVAPLRFAPGSAFLDPHRCVTRSLHFQVESAYCPAGGLVENEFKTTTAGRFDSINEGEGSVAYVDPAHGQGGAA